MGAPRPYRTSFVLLGIALLLSWLLNISSGSVDIPFGQVVSILLQGGSGDTWAYIIWAYRIPKAFTAILVGGGLSLSGLLMQTLFRNPLAGPFVLGISSGASLGAALLLMGTSLATGLAARSLLGNISLALAASVGSFLVLLVVMILAQRVKDSMALLIIGLMFGSISSALVSVLAYFSSAEDLQRFVFWSLGSVGNLGAGQLWLLGGMVALGILLAYACLKPLNAFLLGEHYAQSLGIPLKRSRMAIIIATGLLAGGVTAFAGPIAFVGLAVPHLSRQIFDTMEHRVLIPAVLLYGAVLMLLCDTVAQWPNSATVLPINAITSLVGAPVVIWLLVRKRKMIF